jgi:hypothetical protein
MLSFSTRLIGAHHLRGLWFGPKAALGTTENRMALLFRRRSTSIAASENPRDPTSVVRIVIPLGAARIVDTTGPVNLRKTGDAKFISDPETGWAPRTRQDFQHGVPQLVLVADAARILGKRQNVQPDCPAGEEKNHPAFKRTTCVSVAAQHFLL